MTRLKIKCGNCGYEWISRNRHYPRWYGEQIETGIIPSRCPSCHRRIYGTSNYESQQVTECFIATAAYGTPFAEEINILRYWRDSFLLNHHLGRLFVKVYYKISPPIADFIRKKEKLRAFVRFGLNPFIRLLKKHYVDKK